MKLTWINHASFLLEHGGIRLVCDPWIEGYVFDCSWALLSPTKFTYADFANVTHIWFSHEHPDHFFPPTLNNIPPEIRKNITVLFQTTKDKRLIRFCKNRGFKQVIELPAQWHELEPGVELLCQSAGRGDSWLAVKAGGKLLLNLNDCIYMTKEELEPVRQSLGAVDLLITQFSYASWWGNAGDDDRWRKAAEDMLLKMRREIDVLHPPEVLLSASYVFFCHEENQFMNKHINTVSRAWDSLKEYGKAKPVVLYPGDEWSPGEAWDSASALDRYRNDYAVALADPIKVRSSSVSLEKIFNGGRSFIRTLGRTNSVLLLKRMPAASINITDHLISARLDSAGVKQVPRCAEEAHDIALSSSALLYCLRFPWGGETLLINGRFHAPVKGTSDRFFRWFSVAQANSRATYYNRAYYVNKITSKVRALLGRATHDFVPPFRPMKDAVKRLARSAHRIATGRRWSAAAYLRLFRLAKLLPDGLWKKQLINSIKSLGWPDIALSPARVELAPSIGVRLVPHVREFDFAAHICNRMYYEHQVTSWLKSRDYDVVVEIGANVGIYTLLFSKMMPSSQIYCFEPSRKAYRRLIENLTLNECANVFPFNCAVASESGFCNFYEPDGFLTNGSLDRSFAELFTSSVHPSRVATISGGDIAQLIPAGSKLLLKIDAEGTEPEIVRSLEPLIAAIQPDILIEVLPTTSEELNEIDALKNYRFFELKLAGPKEQESFTASPNRDYALIPGRRLSAAAEMAQNRSAVVN